MSPGATTSSAFLTSVLSTELNIPLARVIDTKIPTCIYIGAVSNLEINDPRLSVSPFVYDSIVSDRCARRVSYHKRFFRFDAIRSDMTMLSLIGV